MTLRLNGATSGSVSLDAPATGSNVSLELPTDSIKPGMVLVAAQSFSGVSSVSVNNCFTATYENYRVLIYANGSSGVIGARMRLSGSDDSSANYARRGFYGGVTSSNTNGSGETSFIFADTIGLISLDLNGPAIARTTRGNWLGLVDSDGRGSMAGVTHSVSTAYDGLTLYGVSITGTLRVYGYRNSL